MGAPWQAISGRRAGGGGRIPDSPLACLGRSDLVMRRLRRYSVPVCNAVQGTVSRTCEGGRREMGFGSSGTGRLCSAELWLHCTEAFVASLFYVFMSRYSGISDVLLLYEYMGMIEISS